MRGGSSQRKPLFLHKAHGTYMVSVSKPGNSLCSDSDRAIRSGGWRPWQEVRCLKCVYVRSTLGGGPASGQAQQARSSYLCSPAFSALSRLTCAHLRPVSGHRDILRGSVSSLFPPVCCSMRRVARLALASPFSSDGRGPLVPASCILCRPTEHLRGCSSLGRPRGRLLQPLTPHTSRWPWAVVGTLSFQQLVGQGRASACDKVMTQCFLVIYRHGVRAFCNSSIYLHAGGMPNVGRRMVSSETDVCQLVKFSFRCLGEKRCFLSVCGTCQVVTGGGPAAPSVNLRSVSYQQADLGEAFTLSLCKTGDDTHLVEQFWGERSPGRHVAPGLCLIHGSSFHSLLIAGRCVMLKVELGSARRPGCLWG